MGANDISRIDFAAIDEVVDPDRSRRFQRDVLELPLCHLDECVGVDLVALDDVLVVDLLAGISVHLGVLDAVAGLSVELVERDFFGFRRCQIERATGQVTEERRRKSFQLARGGPSRGNSITGAGFKTNGPAWFRHRVPSNRMIFLDQGPSGLGICSCYVLIRNEGPRK